MNFYLSTSVNNFIQMNINYLLGSSKNSVSGTAESPPGLQAGYRPFDPVNFELLELPNRESKLYHLFHHGERDNIVTAHKPLIFYLCFANGAMRSSLTTSL